MPINNRRYRLLFLLWLLAGSYAASAQPVHLKSRVFIPEQNIYRFNFSNESAKQVAGGKVFGIIQFNNTITESGKQLLKRSGVELFHYIPNHAYTVAITRNLDSAVLRETGALSFFTLEISDKLSQRLNTTNIPSWAIKAPGKLDIIVHFSKGMDPVAAKRVLEQGNQIIDESWLDYHFLTLRINQEQLGSIASISFIEYIEPAPPEPKTFNYIMRANTRANVLNAPVGSGGEGLRGNGVTIGIGDDADPTDHVDLRDRVINRAAGLQLTHGTHVTGIAAGGGIKDPMLQGVAPLSRVIAQLFNGIFLNAGTYVTDYNMVVTNNSWGNITGECDLAGVYDTYSKLMDDISIQYPRLLNIFAAGNDGPYTCQGYPLQYHTVVSGHQSAKNVLSVAWGEKNQTVSVASSVGPTADGRLKPEITAQGSGVRSTAPGDNYFTDWGTSMAAPNVAGGAALLIEKYRQMNGGADPKSGLIKAVLMNGAKDIENPAPDFKSGYGFLNLLRSVDIIKNNRYASSAVSTGAMNTHNITVPGGTAQLKVMVYWHDPSAAIFAQNSLVNDLDLEVVTPSSAMVLPWKLSFTASNVTGNATRGTDNLNNSEQVTIDNPTSGTYTLRVKGTSVNIGAAQEYFVVYDVLPTGVDLTYPSAGEPLIPGEDVVINWDAWGGPENNFTLQFSSDNGSNWTDINTNIPANARQLTWSVPGIITNQARLRLTRNGTTYLDLSQPFVIVSQPTVALAAIQCEDHISITWNGVSGATDYEVMMKQGVEMIPVAITSNTNHIFTGLDSDSTYWVTVRARVNGAPGRRSVAIRHKPDVGSCAGNISDNDLKMDAIVSPLSGRKFTSTEITTTNLTVRIKNLDDIPATSFTVQYSINGSPFISQNITASIPAGGTYLHTFNGLNFSSPGVYAITAVVKNNTPDDNSVNDTARATIKQLSNDPVTLPMIENFGATPAFEIIQDTIGLPSLDRWDYFNTHDSGRVRSFVNTGIAKSGNRAITLDAMKYIASGNTNYLIGTFNLSNYSAIPPQLTGLILEFSYKHHGQAPHPNNRVWARRSDTDPWIEVFSFDSLDLRPGEWRTVSIHLSNTPAAQSPTASFQLRFGQHGKFSMGDDRSNAGITIDDLVLTTSTYDIELIAIESPVSNGCGPSTQPLTIKFIDHQGIAACIPVKYRVNGGPVVSECIASSGSDRFTFTAIPALPTGDHFIDVWIDHPADTYRRNDSILNFRIVNKPIINVFPYFENFESGTGNWHAEGYRSSWEYGMPSSFKINTAASGTKAWKTSLRGQYNELEKSYLYSPCFDVSLLAQPYLGFKMALDLEECGQFVCDKAWMEYSTDGKTWTKLGAFGQGVNWYNNSAENVWDSSAFTTWHVTGIELPAGSTSLRLRFVLESDAGITREGIAIDDVQVYDRQQQPSDPQWILSPNPTTGLTKLTSVHEPGRKVSLDIFSASGQLVFQNSFTASGFADNSTLNLTLLASGVYFLEVSDGINRKVFKLVRH